jgi:hypothetical protein
VVTYEDALLMPFFHKLLSSVYVQDIVLELQPPDFLAVLEIRRGQTDLLVGQPAWFDRFWGQLRLW